MLCNDVTDLTCSKCTGKLCNNDLKRRGTKCLKCEGLECFGANDPSNFVNCVTGGCYVGLDANGDLLRNCASSVIGSSSCASNDTAIGKCLICHDDFCNGITYPMINRLSCFECLGESCEEMSLEYKFCERIHSNEACVSIFDDSGKVLERGCSSTVQQSAACNSSNPNCIKCGFNRCNTHQSTQEVYYCVSCNSKDDPNCVTNITSPLTKSCRSNQCYSRLLSLSSASVWDQVEKGCVSDLSDPASCTGSSCAACIGDRCNNVPYPSDRISCLSCLNEECKQATIPSISCAKYNRTRQGCITLFNSNNEVNFRGCYLDAANGTQAVCDDTSQLICTKCSTKNCNQNTSRRGRKCYKCKGLECFKPTYPADVVDCLSNCYMGIDEHGESVRDCSNAITNTTCGVDDNGSNRCNVCSNDLCNGIPFPLTNRLQCHTCNDENCEASDDNLEFCERYQAQERCVTVFSRGDKVVERGCSSSLQNQRYCDQNYANCLQCPSSGCNSLTSKVSRLCAVCNSTNDPNCVINPTATTTTRVCSKGCYTRLVNEVLMRGCLEDLEETFQCNEGNKCKYCNDIDKCNVESYPANRKSCYTCFNAAECKYPVPELCINYAENESCASIFSGCKMASLYFVELININYYFNRSRYTKRMLFRFVK